jgi:SAM-dependent methyltransferase
MQGAVSARPRVAVRRGRQGLELRVDGTLASLQRPDRGVTGTVWWALAAPVLLLPRDRTPRVLVLGLAGGSVARAVRALAPGAEIVGVENDPAVLRAARRHFQLDRLGLELREVDARDYLARETRRFDLVVEDLFVGGVRAVRKPEWLLGEGYRRMRPRLRPGGFVSVNTIHETPDVLRALARYPGRVVSLDVRGHWNRIVHCGRDLPAPSELRRRFRTHPDLAVVLAAVALRSCRVPPAPASPFGGVPVLG